MKRDGAGRMFPFIKRDISEWDSGYEPKIIKWGSYKACRQLPCLSGTQK